MQVGDVVVLKSGGPRMTIVGIEKPQIGFPQPVDTEAVCQWFTAEGELRIASFPIEALTIEPIVTTP